MRGDILDYQINKKEADFTAHNLINFYLSPEIYENFIHKFNHNQSDFNYEKYCKIFNLSL